MERLRPAFNMTFVLGFGLLLTACNELDYEPLQFSVETDQIVARGTIDASALNTFEAITRANPKIKVLVLQKIDGSVDDEANLELGRMVREAGFTTIVPSNGLVASGGTDLFLAGAERIIEERACIGVHSWGGFVEGRHVPRTSWHHVPYLKYYRDLAISEEFYWFTLESASINDMHWMTTDEVDRYALATTSSPMLASSETCVNR